MNDKLYMAAEQAALDSAAGYVSYARAAGLPWAYEQAALLVTAANAVRAEGLQ